MKKENALRTNYEYIGMIFGGFGGGSSSQGSSGSSSSSSGYTLTSDLSNIFKAGGGNVEAGKPYIVGEKRPELFVPDTNGRIIPDLSMVQGSNTTNTRTITIGGFSPAINAAPGTNVNAILSATQKQFDNNFVPTMIINAAVRNIIRRV